MIASDEDYKTLYPVILLLRCKVSPNIPKCKTLSDYQPKTIDWQLYKIIIYMRIATVSINYR